MNLSNPPLGRIRRKTYYNLNLVGTTPGSGFAFVGPAANGAPGLFAGILRPVRATSGPDYGSSAPASFAEGADRDMYGNLLPSNATPFDESSERRGRDRITAIFECAETDGNGEPAHGCIQFIEPTTSALALDLVASPDLLDPSAVTTRPFLRILFIPMGGPGARLYLQKQHSWEA